MKKLPLYKKVKIRCAHCNETRIYEFDDNDNGNKSLANQLIDTGFSFVSGYKKSEIYCPRCGMYAHRCDMKAFSKRLIKSLTKLEKKELAKYIKEVAHNE